VLEAARRKICVRQRGGKEKGSTAKGDVREAGKQSGPRKTIAEMRKKGKKTPAARGRGGGGKKEMVDRRGGVRERGGNIEVTHVKTYCIRKTDWGGDKKTKPKNH